MNTSYINITEYSIVEFKTTVIERYLREDQVILSLQFIIICVFDKLIHVLQHTFQLELVISS